MGKCAGPLTPSVIESPQVFRITARETADWLLLCMAIILHIADEATHNFLAVYNPSVLAVRERAPWLRRPVTSRAICEAHGASPHSGGPHVHGR
jgi:hypothetical protein